MVVPSIKQEEKRFGQKDAEGHSGEVQFEMLVGHPLRLTKVAVGRGPGAQEERLALYV